MESQDTDITPEMVLELTNTLFLTLVKALDARGQLSMKDIAARLILLSDDARAGQREGVATVLSMLSGVLAIAAEDGDRLGTDAANDP